MDSKPPAKKPTSKKENLTPTQANSRSQQALQSALIQCQQDLLNTALLAAVVIQIRDMQQNLLWCSVNTDQFAGFQQDQDLETKPEHYIYSAPILDLTSGEACGEVVLFHSLNQANIFGQLAVTQCAEIIAQKLYTQPFNRLTIHAFSVPQKIMINDQSILLTPRQFEIICILILNPMGLTLEQLHIYLYGDEQISLNTLKSEISYLKNKVGELICARTYQIQAEIHADFKELEDAVYAGYLDTVKQLYQGDFFIKTKSPFLNNWQQILSMRINNLLV